MCSVRPRCPEVPLETESRRGDWSQEDTEGFGGDGNVLKPGAGDGCTTEAYT